MYLLLDNLPPPHKTRRQITIGRLRTKKRGTSSDFVLPITVCEHILHMVNGKLRQVGLIKGVHLMDGTWEGI